MMLPLLLDSAARSLLLGLAVWLTLKLVRLRDTRTETAIWTAVLIVALSMPLLSHYSPALVLPVPHLAAAPPQAPTAVGSAAAHEPWTNRWDEHSKLAVGWIVRHGQTYLAGAYLLGVFICLARLAFGLLLSWRLYLRAIPVHAEWTRGRCVRAHAALKGPASFARVILLPADYGEWSVAKREAVLAHEQAHIARSDFFVQLAAWIHCALFWFSPFAWWLQSKLAEIAETASDEAAVRRLNDRITYAEILLEVARGAWTPTPRTIVAMARGSLIQQRVERILSDVPNQNLSLPLQVLVIGALTMLAVAVASATTTVNRTSPPPAIAAQTASVNTHPKRSWSSTPAVAKQIAPAARAVLTRRAPHTPDTDSRSQDPDDSITYNPRALLNPVYVPARNYVPASTIVHAGQSFYVRSTEKPVAEVTVGDRTYRQNR
jgi:beta-lactamase regulating signal transducer with metallopeptidase domain